MEEIEQQYQMDNRSHASNVNFQRNELAFPITERGETPSSFGRLDSPSSQTTSMLRASWRHSSKIAIEGQRSPSASSAASAASASAASANYQLPASPSLLGSQRSSIEKANWEWAWPWAKSSGSNKTALKMITAGPGVYLQGASVPNSPARGLSEWRRSSLQADKQNMPKQDIFKFLKAASAELMTRGDVDSIQQKETRMALRRLRLIPSRSNHQMSYMEEDDDDDLEVSGPEDVRDSQWSLRHAAPQMKRARRVLRDIDRALKRSEVQARILRNQDLVEMMQEPSLESLRPVSTRRRSNRRASASDRKGRLSPSRWRPAVSGPMHAMRQRRRSSQRARDIALAIQQAVHQRAKKLESAVSKETLPPERLTYSYVLRKLRPVAGDAIPSEEEEGAGGPAGSARSSLEESVQWVGLDADVPMPGTSSQRGRRAAAAASSSASAATSPISTTTATARDERTTTARDESSSVTSYRQRRTRRHPARDRERSRAPPASSSSSSERSSLAFDGEARGTLLARVLQRITPDSTTETSDDRTLTASPTTGGRFYSPLNVPFYKLPPSTLQQLVQARRGSVRT